MERTEGKRISPAAIALRALLFAAGYFGCTLLGNVISYEPGVVTTFWPPAGCLTAVFLMMQPRLWPILLAAAIPANAAVDLLYGREPLVGFLFCIGNSIGAMAGAFVYRRLFGGGPRLTVVKQLFGFLAVSGILAPLVGATAGAAVSAVRFDGSRFTDVWGTWWFADVLGVFVVTPLFLAWMPRESRERGPRPGALTVLESCAAAAGLVMSAVLVFTVPGSRAMDLEFLVLPFLIWSALRLDLRVTTLMNLLLALIVVSCTARGLGPFAGGENPAAFRPMILQAFLCIQGTVAIILTAVLEERRKAMERLSASESDLALAQQIGGLGSWSADLSTGVVQWSRQMHVINGTDPDSFHPRLETMADFMDSKDRTVFLDAFRETVSGGACFSRELNLRRPDGSLRTVLVRGEGRPGPDGRLGHVVGTEQDITDRKHAEEQMNSQQRQLIQADKMASLGVLASGVAHEINNPIHTIKLNMQLISDVWASLLPLLDSYCNENGDFLVGGLPYSQTRAEMPAILSGIAEAAGHIESIAGDLKSYARADPTPVTMEINLNLAVKAAATLAGNFIAKATDRFQLELAESLPPIRGNIHRLEQVIINLLQNACQALESKEQAIRVRTSCDPDGGHVTLTVTDGGRGMNPEELAHIKEPFYTTRRSSGGTGLGLSVSDRIVEEHGGCLSYESAPGRGTTAAVRLPAARKPQGGTP